MAKSKTDEEDKNLTPPANGDESPNSSAGLEPLNSDEAELDLKTKTGFQRLVAKREKESQEYQKQLQDKEKELAEARKRLKEKELSELSDTDRLKKQAEELAEENSKLKLQGFVSQEVAKRGLDVNDPLVEILMDTPWSIPAVRRILGDSPTWEEVVSTVQEKLPAYLDTLVARQKTEVKNKTEVLPNGNKSDEDEVPTSTERVNSTTPTLKRYWTRSEIARMSDVEYAKHAAEIRSALSEGRILQK